LTESEQRKKEELDQLRVSGCGRRCDLTGSADSGVFRHVEFGDYKSTTSLILVIAAIMSCVLEKCVVAAILMWGRRFNCVCWCGREVV